MRGVQASQQLCLILTLACGGSGRTLDDEARPPRTSEAITHPCGGVQGPCVPELDRCEGDQSWVGTLDKLAVVAGTRHSHGWLKEADIPWMVYQHDNPAAQNYFVNYANEATAFLLFLYDYYHCLPKAVAFLHGHLGSWHSGNMKETLQNLQWSHLPGYVDLNKKMGIWERPLKALRPRPSKPLAHGEDAYNGSFVRGQVIGGVGYDSWEAYLWHQRTAARQFYDECLGPLGAGAMPDTIAFHCCTQIAVTREQVHKRSRDFYKGILLYLQDNTIKGNHQNNKVYTLGDAVAVHWPIMLNVRRDQLEPDCQVYGSQNCTITA